MFRIFTRSRVRSLLIPAVFLTLGSSVTFAAEPGDVIAKVGSVEIKEADLAFAAQGLGPQLQQVPPAQWRSILLDVIVDMNLLSEAARKEGLDQTEDFKKQMQFLKMQNLRNAYLSQKIEPGITEEDLKKAYEAEFADFKGEDEMKARHILVKEKADAESVIKELDGGADFAELAKAKSTGPSGPKGGDLGFFAKGQMVKPFEEAVLSLEPGKYTKEPVETQFGWHVILLEEKRKQPKPSFEDVKEGLRRTLSRTRYEELMVQLKKDTPVEILDESLAKKEKAE